jgi:hypothetical protein
MGGAGGTYGEENFTQGMVGKLEIKRKNLVHLGISGRKILKWLLRQGRGIHSIYQAQDEGKWLLL